MYMYYSLNNFHLVLDSKTRQWQRLKITDKWLLGDSGEIVALGSLTSPSDDTKIEEKAPSHFRTSPMIGTELHLLAVF